MSLLFTCIKNNKQNKFHFWLNYTIQFKFPIPLKFQWLNEWKSLTFVLRCSLIFLCIASLLLQPLLPWILKSISQSINQFICPSVSPSILSICSLIHPSVSLSVCHFIHLSLCRSLHLSFHPSASQSVSPSVSQSVSLSVHPSVCLSVHQSVSYFW